MSVEENKALYERWTAAISGADWATMYDILAPDFAFHNPTTPTLRDSGGSLTVRPWTMVTLAGSSGTLP